MRRAIDIRGRGAKAFLAAISGAGCLLLAACMSTPLERDGERSQYDRHEALRGNYAEAYVEDEFGRMIPNLRGRLLSKE